MDKTMQTARRELLRWRILGAVYQDRLHPMGDELIVNTMRSRLVATIGEVRGELTYLEQRKLIKVVSKQSDHWAVALTWTGIDLIEYTIPVEPGIARPILLSELAPKQTASYMARGRILEMLVASLESGGYDESIIDGVVYGHDFHQYRADLRLELHYLELRGLITISDKDSSYWFCELTREGTDVAQGTVACFPGVTLRPECYRRS